MRLLSLSMVAILTLAFAAACSSSDKSSDGKLRVVATTTQIGDFAQEVGGDRISLTVLLKPNQDAHDFEPEPSQLRALTQADVVLRNGIGLDTFVNRALENGNAKAVIVTEGITLRGAEEELHEEEGHADEDEEAAHEEAAGHDPHVWFSTANAKIMVENVRDALSETDAANAAFYIENARTYLAELDQLTATIQQQVNSIPSSCRKLVTNHDVLHYYANTYGFQVVGSVIPSVATDAQPSAADVAGIVRSIRSERVPAIFAEASVNPALIRQVGREAGVKVVDDLYGDSLGPKNSDGGTYMKMMETNTRKIVDALKDCPA